MASAGDIHSILFKGDVLQQQFRPKYDPTKKVKRYFPGKAPDYAPIDFSDEEFSSGDEEDSKKTSHRITEFRKGQKLDDTQHFDVDKLEKEGVEQEDEEPIEAARFVKRRRREVIEQPLESSDHEKERVESILPESSKVLHKKTEDQNLGDVEVNRREKIRLKALEERKKEEERLQELIKIKQIEAKEQQIEESDDEEESEESENEEDVHGLKPIFIPAAKRDLLKEKQNLEKEEAIAVERKEKELQERKKDSKKQLIELVRQEEEEEKRRTEQPSDFSLELTEMPDDDDGIDEETEYELWKIRELKRIKRDKEEEDERMKEQEQILRRRNMTDAERREDDRRLDAQQPAQSKKGKYTFLQKYYHKGAFFQDLAKAGTEPVYLRDFNLAVGEDVVDKKTLPKPMQLRRGQFGKAGQVKHTHLAAEDTTDYTSAWAQTSRQRLKYQEKMAGIKATTELERPSARALRAEQSKDDSTSYPQDSVYNSSRSHKAFSCDNQTSSSYRESRNERERGDSRREDFYRKERNYDDRRNRDSRGSNEDRRDRREKEIYYGDSRRLSRYRR